MKEAVEKKCVVCTTDTITLTFPKGTLGYNIDGKLQLFTDLITHKNGSVTTLLTEIPSSNPNVNKTEVIIEQQLIHTKYEELVEKIYDTLNLSIFAAKGAIRQAIDLIAPFNTNLTSAESFVRKAGYFSKR